MTNLPDQRNGNADEAEDIQPGAEAETFITSAINLFADLERERLALQREQQSVTLRGWEIADNTDRRNNETAAKRIEAENERDRRRHRLAVYVIILLAGVPLALLTLAVVMAFFGDERQSQIALNLLGIVGTALGGAGVVFLVAFAVNRLVSR